VNATPITDPPTALQVEALAFVAEFTKREGHAPVNREIAEHFRIACSGAHARVLGLARRGLLERKGQSARTLRLTKAGRKLLAEREAACG
jgi:DNA-binding MarR family transcriptional regulator